MTKKNVIRALVVAVIVLVLDQISKHWALSELIDGQTISLLGDFLSLHLVHNPGAAFSFLDNATWVFTLIATLFVVFFPFFLRRVTSGMVVMWGAMIWGGAFGNLIDRLLRAPGFPQGHVVDFIQYSDWFIGNIADIALVVGFIGLGAHELFGSSTPEPDTVLDHDHSQE
ncbi:signal peptidase II [Arcanobacterium pinnipediorum]|uniref:Lipoprotein signal peptidase n=1 Tax=Arcanobacterium pinnipediorum TaxID=1503041 RepID=A0ABY5ALB1_9ACTO|nr:signal peptidase II [Arcanobacterium pinnipediorum]USR80039.1 signal peptidase II [Arcanobacterium pinnipediorum]